MLERAVRREPATEGEALNAAESRQVVGMTRVGVDITGELRRRDVERELLTSPWTGRDCRRMEESVGMDVGIRLA
jgi:hypothetical protein